MHLKMTEVLGTVHTRGSGYSEGDDGQGGPNLVLDQMAAPVAEIVDGCLYNSYISFSFFFYP
jgi:hypothetical protein